MDANRFPYAAGARLFTSQKARDQYAHFANAKVTPNEAVELTRRAARGRW